ncbi:extensin [Streptomyces phaeochromogenes]|uniref:extensin n=1 Tax=Streptomyces phaeochromogenes TaxID=1923 RepID=UPI00224E1138|nr:extensin [Streptomyces phaeochromogenes]MCX5605524.1 extensin [Streptomyces phaeochromogenes]
MRSLAPARALTPAPAPAAPPAGPHRATPAVVPLRRPSPSGTGPAVQRRAVAPSTPVGRAVPLLSAAKPGSGTTPPAVTPRTTPRPNALPAAPVVQRHAAAAPKAPGSAPGNTVTTTAAPAPIPVQRDKGGPQPTPAKTTTAVSTVSARGTSSQGSSGSGSASDQSSAHDSTGEPPPGYTPVAKGQFDPRSLTDFQLDELTHRLIGRITRLVRTELRLDRERIGKLRDPRR